jgi:hypothetical protein
VPGRLGLGRGVLHVLRRGDQKPSSLRGVDRAALETADDLALLG